MEIYERVKKLCKSKGTSVYALEKELGIGNGTIGKWGKNGRVPNYSTLAAVAEALEIPITSLMEDDDPLYSAARDAVYQKEFMALTEAEKKAALSVVAFCKKNAPTLNFEDERIAKLLRLAVQLTPEQLDLLAALVSGSQPKQE